MCAHLQIGGTERRTLVGRGSRIQDAGWETGSAFGSWEGTEQDRSVSGGFGVEEKAGIQGMTQGGPGSQE